MSARTKSTLKMICVGSGIANVELPKEAQKLLELYRDPNVSPEQKSIAKAELDDLIKTLEERVTTRRMRDDLGGGIDLAASQG